MTNVTIFSQILALIPRSLVEKQVKKYQSDKHNKGINTWTHLVSLLFCHFARAHSLRDISNGLRSIAGNVTHLGIMDKIPTKSSLSYINGKRDWQTFRAIYLALKDNLQGTGLLQRKQFKEIDRKIYLMDSSVISVCLKIYNWAIYRNQKGAVKLHTMLDYDGCVPSYIYLGKGKQADVNHAKYMTFPKGSVLVLDRGYYSSDLFKQWANDDIFFVTRLKEKVLYSSLTERELPEQEEQHILKDEEIVLSNQEQNNSQGLKLRRVCVYDTVNKKELVLLTNNFSWTAGTVAELYKQRWQIEIFFKELKGHLKIKSFLGTTENAMWIQIWTALITMLLLRVMKEKATHNWNLSNLITFLRINLFVKLALTEWLNQPFIDKKTEKMMLSKNSFLNDLGFS